MLKLILLIAVIPSLVLGFTPFRPCKWSHKQYKNLCNAYNLAGFAHSGAGINAPFQVRVAGCTVSPCPVHQETTVLLETDFVAPHAATSLLPIMRMGFAGVFINYNLGLTNACGKLSRDQCPLAPNAASTFHLIFPVTTAHPPVPTTVELTLRNHLHQDIVCGFVDFLVFR